MDNNPKIELSTSSELLKHESSSNALNEVWGTLAEHKDAAIKTGLVAASLATAALTYSFFRGNVGGVSASIGRMLGSESLPEGAFLLDGRGTAMEASRLGSGEVMTAGLGGAEQFGARLEHAARFGGGLGYDAELHLFDSQAVDSPAGKIGATLEHAAGFGGGLGYDAELHLVDSQAGKIGATLEHAAGFGGGLGYDVELELDSQAGKTAFRLNDFDEALSGRVPSTNIGFGGRTF